MSTKTIEAFLKLQDSPKLFTPDTHSDLGQLANTISSLAASDANGITQAIQSFCRKHQKVRESIQSYLETQMGPGGEVSLPPTPADKLKEQVLIMITNAIRVNPPKPVSPPKPK